MGHDNPRNEVNRSIFSARHYNHLCTSYVFVIIHNDNEFANSCAGGLIAGSHIRSCVQFQHAELYVAMETLDERRNNEQSGHYMGW